jgi:hypothetical protein
MSRLFILVLKIDSEFAPMISLGSLFHMLTVLYEKKFSLAEEFGMVFVLK